MQNNCFMTGYIAPSVGHKTLTAKYILQNLFYPCLCVGPVMAWYFFCLCIWQTHLSKATYTHIPGSVRGFCLRTPTGGSTFHVSTHMKGGNFTTTLKVWFQRGEKRDRCNGWESNPGQLLGRQLCSPLYHHRKMEELGWTPPRPWTWHVFILGLNAPQICFCLDPIK